MRSHLLLLRVWPETLGKGKVEWRGRIQSMHSGEVRHFRDDKTLYGALLRIIDGLEEDLDDDRDDVNRDDENGNDKRGGDFRLGPTGVDRTNQGD